MSDEEHSDSEFYYPEEHQETAERKASPNGGDFDKVEVNGDTQWCTESISTGRGGGVFVPKFIDETE